MDFKFVVLLLVVFCFSSPAQVRAQFGEDGTSYTENYTDGQTWVRITGPSAELLYKNLTAVVEKPNSASQTWKFGKGMFCLKSSDTTSCMFIVKPDGTTTL